MKQTSKTKLTLILIAFTVTLLCCFYLFKSNKKIMQQNTKLKQELVGLETVIEENIKEKAPEITEISFENITGNDLYKDRWVTVGEDNKIKIKIKVKGDCTSVDLFIAPTGTETYLLQEIIDSLTGSPNQNEFEYIWDVPKGTIAHFWIIAYNGNNGQKSESFNIYNE